MSHRTSLLSLLGDWVHWLAQLIRDFVPGLSPLREPASPPTWWLYWEEAWLWFSHVKYPDYKPSRTCIEYALRCIKRELGRWIEEVGEWARDVAITWTRDLVGYVAAGYSTVASWVGTIESRVGTFWATWASDISNGLWALYNWLPYEIRAGIRTWSQIWEDLKEHVRQWAREQYDGVRTWFNNVWSTYRDIVNLVNAWYIGVCAVVNAINLNPRGFITGQLGTHWIRLERFSIDCLNFWYDLWGIYRSNISGLLSDPLGWLYDRAEDYILSKW